MSEDGIESLVDENGNLSSARIAVIESYGTMQALAKIAFGMHGAEVHNFFNMDEFREYIEENGAFDLYVVNDDLRTGSTPEGWAEALELVQGMGQEKNRIYFLTWEKDTIRKWKAEHPDISTHFIHKPESYGEIVRQLTGGQE